jgi:putative transposase
MIKDRPPRLDLIFVEQPLYFVTFATWNRQIIPSLELAQSAFDKYAQRASRDFNVGVGRYVIMPDHIHLFVRGDGDFSLSQWSAGLKRAISNALKVRGTFWQPGFFDHILRSDESYSEKWNYVHENPVRAGLVKDADDWRFQGGIVLIDRV